MLKKLFKYEWRDVWKIVGGLNLVVLLLSLLSGLVYNREFMDTMSDNEYVAMVFVLYNMLYYVAIMALGLATNFIFIYRFYKNMYTDEGYLMHTLPVKTTDLIWSKAFVAVIWNVISYLMIFIAFMNYMDKMMLASGEQSFWLSLLEVIKEIPFVDIPAQIIPTLIFVVIIILVTPFYGIFFGYTAVSLGQLTKKHKLLAAVGIYFGLNYGIQVITTFAMVPLNKFFADIDFMSDNQMYQLFNCASGIFLLVILIVTVLCYFTTHKVMKTKLNLE